MTINQRRIDMKIKANNARFEVSKIRNTDTILKLTKCWSSHVFLLFTSRRRENTKDCSPLLVILHLDPVPKAVQAMRLVKYVCVRSWLMPLCVRRDGVCRLDKNFVTSLKQLCFKNGGDIGTHFVNKIVNTRSVGVVSRGESWSECMQIMWIILFVFQSYKFAKMV